MSTENVPHSKWNLGLSIFLITLIAGVFVLILLSLGVADPPRAGELAWQTDTTDDWPLLQRTGEWQHHTAPLPLPNAPFTLEITASNNGTPDSAWGLWLRTTDGLQTFLVSSEGYMSVSNDDNAHWAQFIHVHITTNKLYLHIQGNQSATFRINDEIAWQGVVTLWTEWGVAMYGSADITWQNIHLYAGK